MLASLRGPIKFIEAILDGDVRYRVSSEQLRLFYQNSTKSVNASQRHDRSSADSSHEFYSSGFMYFVVAVRSDNGIKICSGRNRNTSFVRAFPNYSFIIVTHGLIN